ncbi:MAG: ribosome maturation factor RimM [bacterium]
MADYFVLGKIVNTQGVKGEVRVLPTTDDINQFKKLKSIEIFSINKKGITTNTKDLAIESARFHKQFVLLKFKGVDDMNEAEKLKNFEIRIPKEQAIPCKQDEYFICDLYDMQVFTEDGEFLGLIDDIMFTGANDVYVVKKELEDEDNIEDNIKDNKNNKVNKIEILIPAIKQCILNVDVNKNIMTVHLLEGLR